MAELVADGEVLFSTNPACRHYRVFLLYVCDAENVMVASQLVGDWFVHLCAASDLGILSRAHRRPRTVARERDVRPSLPRRSETLKPISFRLEIVRQAALADLSLACWIYPLVGAAPYNPETRFFRNGAMQFNALRSFIASSLHSAPALASLPPSALH